MAHVHEFDLTGKGNEIDFDGDSILVQVKCESCGLEATEIYKLQNVMLKDGAILEKGEYKVSKE